MRVLSLSSVKDFGILLVLAQYLEVGGKGPYGVQGIAVLDVVVEGQVDEKPVLELAADDGHALYLGEVHAVEGEDGEHFGQRTLCVTHAEVDAGLVDFVALDGQDRCELVLQNEETGEVALVGLYPAGQYLHAVQVGGILRADGGMANQVALFDDLGRTCRIGHLGYLDIGQARLQEDLALTQGYRVRIDLDEVVHLRARQSAQDVADVQAMLAHNLQLRVAQQFVVLQQVAGYGVLDGHDAQYARVCGQGVEHALKGRAAHRLKVLAGEVLLGRPLVVTSLLALYGHLHFAHICVV